VGRRRGGRGADDPLLTGVDRGLIAPGDAVRRALAWYLSWSLAAILAVAVGSVLLSGVVARREALRDAEETARAVAEALVVPLADQGFHSGDSRQMARMTQALEDRSRDGSISHIKIWADAGSGRGTVLWSDERPLLGQTFLMEPEEYALFGTTDSVTDISDLAKDENELERPRGQLVEVYTGIVDAAAVPLLFESYVTTDGMDRQSWRLFRSFLPLPLGAVLVLAIATLPLATSLAKRVDRGQQQMRRLLVNAVASSDLERRRTAQALHDGVIQDLAGVGYALAAEQRHLPPGEMRGRIGEVHGIVTRDIQRLRDLMMDIHPPDLDEGGLPEALRSLVRRSDFGDARVIVDVQPGLSPGPLVARVAYRLIREVLRNASVHSRARNVTVRVGQRGDSLEFEVVDDGVGFQPAQGRPEGHLGLRLVREMAADAGGRLTIESAPGDGTRVRATLPL
jgi:two-component system NarL family sensor kinase